MTNDIVILFIKTLVHLFGRFKRQEKVSTKLIKTRKRKDMFRTVKDKFLKTLK